MEGQASISSEVLARYAADAAGEVEGVRGFVVRQRHRHRGVRVSDEEAGITVELHLDVEWGAQVPMLGREVQRRVGDYLERMAGLRPAAVNIVVDSIGPAQ